MKNNTLMKILRRTGAILFWVAVWWGVSLLVGKPLLLPSPAAVLACLFRLGGTAAFWQATGLSLLRIFLGILLGTVVGVLLSCLSVASKTADNLLTPLLTAVKSTPVASFIILALLWIGRDFVPVLITFLIVLPVVWANGCAGLRAVDPALLEVSWVYHLRPLDRLLHNYLPAYRPHLLSALRSSVGLGWKAGIAAEVLTVPALSIGKRLYDAKLYLETEELFAWTLTVVVLSLLLEAITFRLLGAAHRVKEG